MRTSATGNKRARPTGFTLLELMVVIAIMGLATAVVVLSMRGSGARGDAEGLAARMLAARDMAIIEARDVAVWVSPTASGVERRRRGEWQDERVRPFAPADFRAGTTALTGNARQRIVFDTTGGTQPAIVTLDRNGARATVRIDADGTIRVES